MNFAPTLTQPSTALAGVTFTVARIGFGKRADIDFQTLPLRQRLRELEADYPPLSEREKPLSEALEIARRKSLAVPAAEFDAVVRDEVVPLAQELAAAAAPTARKQRAVLEEEYRTVEAKIRAQWIRAGLLAIQGGDVDGMSAEQLLEYGPPALAEEIYEALANDGKLDGASSKNFPQPITSGAVGDGPKTNTTAAGAVILPAAGTSPETASSISRAM